MRHILFIIAWLCSLHAITQPLQLANPADSAAFFTDIERLQYYFFKKPDSALSYALRLYNKGEELDNYPVMNFSSQVAGEMYRTKGNFVRSIEMQLRALKLNRANEDKVGEAYTRSYIGFTFSQFGDFRQGVKFLRPAFEILNDNSANVIQTSFTASNLAYCYTRLGNVDSAAYFNDESVRLWALGPDTDQRKNALRCLIADRLGNASEAEGYFADAVMYYRNEQRFALENSIRLNVSRSQTSLAAIFEKMGQADSSILYGRNAIMNSSDEGQVLHTIRAAEILARTFKNQGNADSALAYSSMAATLKDSVFGVKTFSDLQVLMLREQEEQQQSVINQSERQNQLKLLLAAVVAAALLVVALILRHNNKLKQSANRELERQKSNLERTLEELRATQSQLIQSEKMASLGELTAGIAHEIQNPLNFVNNFSEVNKELIDDLKTEIGKGNLNEAKAITNDIAANEEKINHHGKRADAIVKSMLEHSRKGSGQKELTDINALCDEFLRLSYHGLRAKDKSFNASFKTQFDPAIPRINVVRQDLGRVILNLINNGFYAVSERRKADGASYDPLVSLETARHNGAVHITVRDNGMGIPENIKEKIFQPFFTTKPAGKGTGLGLSLSYDIVTLGHGGEIKIETKENEGSAFTIIIPDK